MKRLSARARKALSKITNSDSRCIPVGTIVCLDSGATWLVSSDDKGSPVLMRRH